MCQQHPWSPLSQWTVRWHLGGHDSLANVSSYSMVHPLKGVLVCLSGCFCQKLLIQEKISCRLSYPPLDITYREDSPRNEHMALQCAKARRSTQNSRNTALSDSCLHLLFYESDSGHENVFVLLERDWWTFLKQSYFTSAFFFTIYL